MRIGPSVNGGAVWSWSLLVSEALILDAVDVEVCRVGEHLPRRSK